LLTPLATLLFIILFSIIVNKIATKALVRTGLSRDVASFQAQSAFSGAGFTTSESEYVVNHPVRRRIIRILMLLGSAGLTSSMAALVLTFIGQTREGAALRLGVLAIGLLALYAFASSKTVDRLLGKLIDWGLDRFTSIRVVDYESLLGVGHGYIVSSFKVSPGSWLAGRVLRELRLKDEGILVLGIYRRLGDGSIRYIGTPGPDTRILPGDEVIVYGHEEAVASLSRRLAGLLGELEHEEMVERQRARATS
jgi:hypothetical protein